MTVPMVPTLINGRWELLLPEHRAERPQWRIENGGWEPERLASMAANIGRGDVVYDVGAEEGDMPALWAQWGAEVVLFEPNPRVWPNIRAIFDANLLTHRVLGCWVGFAGPTDYVPMPSLPGTGWATAGHWPTAALGPVIGDHGFLNLSERPDVPAVTLNTAATRWAPPTAVTIDVEGAELAVLQGAAAVVLTDHRPLLWVSVHPEFMAEMYGTSPDDLAQLLGAHGYQWRVLAHDHEAHWFCWPAERAESVVHL
jgi:FkbM family methyltransferase